MSTHVVLGTGGIGRAVAAALRRDGHEVIMGSRSGVSRRPLPEGARLVAVDATDAAALAELFTGAESVTNAINPPKYSTWDRDWPPVAAAILEAVEKTGVRLVTVSNLYGYGIVNSPMGEGDSDHPNGHKGALRAAMWAEAKALTDAGRIRATELRASDYFGPGATKGMSIVGDLVISRVAGGGRGFMPMGHRDAPHSWTYLPDIGSLAAHLATDDRAIGRVWHVPNAAPRSVQQVADDTARIAGTRAGRVRVLPRPVGTALGVVWPLVRELRETRHQFERPFVVDSTLTEQTFGVAATPWEQALTETVANLHAGKQAGKADSRTDGFADIQSR